ncbi:MAG: HD domain-containing protein [Minisyncoccia bacterium]
MAKIKKINDKLEKITDFLFEAGMLAKTPRSGFTFLGSGEQSVSEHTNRVCYVGFALANMVPNIDQAKVLEMCLFHDFAEARVSDLNYVHQMYNKRNEAEAVNDLTSELPFGDKVKKIIHEYEVRESYEAKIAKDSDIIEWILSLKEQLDMGNGRATVWINNAVKRLKTKEAKELAEKIIKVDSNQWWDKENEDWWVNRIKRI